MFAEIGSVLQKSHIKLHARNTATDQLHAAMDHAVIRSVSIVTPAAHFDWP